jgi:hypothetical protein
MAPPSGAFVRRLFEEPGQRASSTATLLAAAAACHRRLLRGAVERNCQGPVDALDALLAAVAEETDPDGSRSILNHPLLIDALHALSSEDPELRAWDDATAPRGPSGLAAAPTGHGREKLNNVAGALLVRQRPTWCGQMDLCTDALGFLRFPSSEWSLWLRTSPEGHAEPLANTLVSVAFEPQAVRWALAQNPDDPFLIMARPDCWRFLVASDPRLSLARLLFPNPAVRPRLIYGPPLGDSGLHYEPAGFDDSSFASHAGLTGALIQAMLDAIHQNAPAIHDEFGRYLAAIRGYELPTGPDQTLASFSTPNLPGIMNVNILYSPDDQPLLSPFCFTWLGHELGHTKHYLIDDAAYEAGWCFVRNPGDLTGPVPRYGRPLGVRTLFQLPYVHLYELALLTSFFEKRFAGLPWDVREDPVAFGDDLVAEIREAFDLIEQWADMTALGSEALTHIRLLYKQAVAHWNTLRR